MFLMGAFLELKLEPAVRLIYQFTILIPSYKAHEMVPFWPVPRIKRTLLKQTVAQTDCQKEKRHQSCLQSCLRLWLRKINTKVLCSNIFNEYVFFGEWTSLPFNSVVWSLIIYEINSSSSSSSNSKTNTKFVFIHI